jgi:hypothetical protein
MARLSFRQGIASHQTDTNSNPVFLDLTTGYVNLVVSPDPTIIAFVHDDSDYLYTESVSVNQAWGPIASGVNSWLYWDLDLVDGTLTRAITPFEPVESNNPPTNPGLDQMWYRPSKKTWYTWNGARFEEVVRCFAAAVIGGTIIQSMSINAPLFTGSQVGLTTRRRVGSLVFGKNQRALRNTGTNKFFTTEDDFLTGVPTSAALRINNNVISGRTVCSVAAYQVVEYNDFNSICLANPAQEGRRLFGIIEEDAALGEIVNFITEGVIFNEQWDWVAAGAQANDPLWIDGTGRLVRDNPTVARLPVAIVIGRQEILFAPRLFVTVDVNITGDGLTPAQEIQLNTATTVSTANQANISTIITTTIPGLELDISTLQTDVADRVLRAGDTMTGPLFGITTVDLDPPTTLTTKDYVDTKDRGYQSTFDVTIWAGSNPRLFVIPPAIHNLPLNTLYHVTVKDTTTTKIVSIDTEIDEITGVITIKTNGAAFAGVIRIT